MTDTLLVEDLMLLLLDDETGTPAGAGTLHYTLGGAVLVDLALRGRIGTDGDDRRLNGPRVFVTGEGPLRDPLLQTVYDRIAERPQRVQPLLLAIGGGLREPVIERLLERGLIRHEKRRVLGLFRMNALPAADGRREAGLRERIGAALEDGEDPDARTAALIALLSASGALPAVRPALPRSRTALARAKDFEKGNWGAEAVSTAVTRTAAAIAAAGAAAAAAVTVTTTS
ncbi:hypothetical protein GCM10027445_20010 [Amycolatopsis endophytica]|uniref:GPP34 family phosphoprotein n=1 Tax=Amycolatopsis endophytica TaxID=860233 RepID=A0A853BF39_9PSEU|nr:GPP34 family phosphoprotein [Amycolatopsis endophytica]NYI93106.1 hypothetical protein [Amycolatopsis endophytica]